MKFLAIDAEGDFVMNESIAIGDVVFSVVAKPGFLLCDGLTIGSFASNATARANDDTQELWEILWDVSTLQMYTSAGVASDRGIKASDWAANRAIALPSLGQFASIKFTSSPDSSAPQLDPDVEAYIAAHAAVGSALSNIEKQALQILVVELKQSLWTKLNEIYVFLGSNLSGGLIRLKPATAAINNGLLAGDFTTTGVQFNSSQKWIQTNFGVGNRSAISAGVYVNRAAGMGANSVYLAVGMGNNGIYIYTDQPGGHGAYFGATFSNQTLIGSRVGFFAGSYSMQQSAFQRIPYVNGVAGAPGPNTGWLSPSSGSIFAGTGSTRLAGGFLSNTFLTAEEQSAIHTLFHQFNTTLGRNYQ